MKIVKRIIVVILFLPLVVVTALIQLWLEYIITGYIGEF
jgi:hypothetical protein